MNITGVWTGITMLVAIGLGFLWVIKLEYHVGAHVWKLVLALGVGITAVSLFMPSFASSALLGILGGSVVWGALELPDQEARVRRGLFPANPKRRGSQESER